MSGVLTGPGGPDRASGSGTMTTSRPDHGSHQRPHDTGTARRDERAWWEHRSVPLLLGFGVYLVLAVVLWWNAWSAHPTTTTTCGCGDASLFLWFLEWPAYALAHGHNLFHSTALFHPGGFNLLSNTGVLAIGIVFAPVTWLFGPVATLNVASTLTPALSALAMFWLLRRWVTWTPAAFLGGLLFGFSPFVVVGLSTGWLTTLLVVPPLVVACLDELFVRQRRRPTIVGLVLGLLVVLQFFLGTELLAIMALTGVVGVVFLVAYAALRDPADLRRRIPHAAVGLGVAAIPIVVLLAYPAWFALAGPSHFAGSVWPGQPPGLYGISLPNFWQLGRTTSQVIASQQRLGGYQGSGMPQSFYLATGLIAVVVAGTVIWYRDRRLWLFGAVGVVSASFCLGVFSGGNRGIWVPWRVLATIPVIQNIVPVRFAAITFLCASVALGLIIDHVHTTAGQWTARLVARRTARQSVRQSRDGQRQRTGLPQRRVVAAVAALAVALVALVPMATSYGDNVPLAMRPVVLPQWFQQVAPRLPNGQVVFAYPAAFGGIQTSMAWQAVDRLHFAMAGGGGPAGVAARAGKERAGFEALANATVSLVTPTPTRSTILAVRQALTGWGVTTVVVPDQPELPAYDQGMHTAYTVGLLTAALGERPQYQAHAWVWTGVSTSSKPSLRIAPDVFQTCVGSTNYRSGPYDDVPNCVVAGSTS